MASIEYIAGFIDGEGHVSIARIPRRNRSHEYCVRLSITNTNRQILEEIRKSWGGHLATVSVRKPGWKRSYVLVWTNAAAGRLLAEVAPYLRVKSRQAVALRSSLDHIHGCRRRRNKRGQLLPLSPRDMEIREVFYSRLRSLNRRGPGAAIHSDAEGGDKSIYRLPGLGYLAGFVDAEGSLMIAKSTDRRYRRPHYRARISIGNTDRAVLEDLRRTYGGILANQPSREVGWKDAYQLVWTNGMIDWILPRLSLHLRIKRRQAQVLMDFVRHVRGTRQGRQGKNGRFFAPLPAEIIAQREAFRGLMRQLNAKGTSPSARART